MNRPTLLCEAHPEWIRLHEIAWQTAESNLETPSAPGWKPQLTCMPGADCLWVWDSCFITLYARYGNGTLPVMNNLDNLYRLQREDGFIGMAYRISTDQLAYGERLNPPLFAWAEWEYARGTGDTSRLPTVLPKLVALFDWIKANRRRENGLYWFEDSGSSGMDNSPRSGYFAQNLDGSDVCHIDLISQQALSAQCIAQIARQLGNESLAARFDAEHSEISTLLNQLHWEPRSGFYYDLFHRTEPDERPNFLNHKTAAAFWPMLAGCASLAQAQTLITHLLNPAEFWTPHPIPSLSRDDPNYRPEGGYWLGGVWAPTNTMIVKGLARYHRADLGRQIVSRHLDAMSAVLENEAYGSIFECYAPDVPQPATRGNGKLVRPHFVGWSGLGPISLLIEEMLGFDFNGLERRIHWRHAMPGRHGIRGMAFAGGSVSLISSGRLETSGSITLEIESDVAFHLEVELPGRSQLLFSQEITPGQHTFVLAHDHSAVTEAY